MPILPFKKGVAEGFCFKVILDISFKAGHNCEFNDHGVCLWNSAAAAWQHIHANPYRPA